ncbi:MAG: TorD/DmsD family molecular chaperone [Symbiobacteriia bacterium]
MARDELRADVYELLGTLLHEPTESLFESLASGGVGRVLEAALQRLAPPALGALASPLPTLADLKRAYWDAFVDPMAPRVVPVESVYRPWSESPGEETGMGAAKGYLLSDRGLHLRELYRALGVAVPDGFEAMPDHLALELEFMGLLCRDRSPEDQAQFLRDHLDWLDRLAEDARGRQIPRFYSAVLDLAASFSRWDALHTTGGLPQGVAAWDS